MKGRYDDLFAAVLEENAALGGKLSEASVRTVQAETRAVNETPVETRTVVLDMKIETVETSQKVKG